MSRLVRLTAALAVALIATAALSTPALAHERRNVGAYTFVVGLLTEPAFANTINGLDLTVTETASTKPVEGLEKTLKAEVVAGGGSAKLPLTVASRFGMPGKYQGQFFPTRAGDYTFHVFGAVGTQNVDEKFESGPNRFNPIEDPSALAFPDKQPSLGEVGAKLDSLQTLAIASLILSVVALAGGATALLRTR